MGKKLNVIVNYLEKQDRVERTSHFIREDREGGELFYFRVKNYQGPSRYIDPEKKLIIVVRSRGISDDSIEVTFDYGHKEESIEDNSVDETLLRETPDGGLRDKYSFQNLKGFSIKKLLTDVKNLYMEALAMEKVKTSEELKRIEEDYRRQIEDEDLESRMKESIEKTKTLEREKEAELKRVNSAYNTKSQNLFAGYRDYFIIARQLKGQREEQITSLKNSFRVKMHSR